MSTTRKSAIAAGAFSPSVPRPAGVSVRLATSRYGVVLGSAVQIGFLSYSARNGDRYPCAAETHGLKLSASCMKAANALQALGNLVKEKVRIGNARCSSV